MAVAEAKSGQDLDRITDIYGKSAGPRRPITPYQKKGPSRPTDTSKGGACGDPNKLSFSSLVVTPECFGHLHTSWKSFRSRRFANLTGFPAGICSIKLPASQFNAHCLSKSRFSHQGLESLLVIAMGACGFVSNSYR